MAIGPGYRSRVMASSRRIGSGSQRTYSVEGSVFFEDGVAEVFGVVWSDAGAVGVVLQVNRAPRFVAAVAGGEVAGADDTYARHWEAMARASPG